MTQGDVPTGEDARPGPPIRYTAVVKQRRGPAPLSKRRRPCPHHDPVNSGLCESACIRERLELDANKPRTPRYILGCCTQDVHNPAQWT